MTTHPNALSPDQLRRVQDPASFDFESTAALPTLDEIIGQERAIRAVEFGIHIESPGYHLFALGTPGTGKTAMVSRFLERQAAGEPVPDDWAYVNNFANPDQPIALRFPAGRGHELCHDMDRLAEDLATDVPQAFETEQYDREQQQIQDELQRRQQEVLQQLRAKAEEHSFTLVQTGQGLLLAPLVDGEVINPETFSKLSPEQQQQLEANQAGLQDDFRDSMRRVQALQQQAKDRLRELDRQAVRFVVGGRIEDIKERYAGFPEVQRFLDSVLADILENVQAFKRGRQAEQSGPELPLLAGQRPSAPTYDQYRVNLVIDNSETKGAPVVLERNPTYANLVGRAEQQVQFGALVTNFRMIKGGALHRANGGYLMVEARDLLVRPQAWEALKRALKNKEIKIETMYESYGILSTRSLEPAPIPLDVKVVLIGDPQVYYLFFGADEDFRELFKVKADFADQMDWEQETANQFARFIGGLAREENLRHFDRSGVARVIEESSRMVDHQHKLAARFGDIADLLRQASYWAGQNGHDLVQAGDVRQAIEEKVYRSNRVEERIREMVEEQTILIDTRGAVVGQVNGLSVIQLGDYSFGRPSRITARTFVGGAGLVNIERETEMAGRIHNKGSLILAGYLGGRYAQDQPLALSASITFEQLYEGVEGDSAASAELYALLSSLSGFPIRQDLAATGSVNQRGQVQAIGGVNEKIEGFFDVCRIAGLTGSQGVLIPRSNARHLMLREDVVEAVREGRFHVYAVANVDEGIALLTGKPAGERCPDGSYDPDTVNHAVQRRLRELAERGKDFAKADKASVDGQVQPEPGRPSTKQLRPH
jgi:lon-related putative ATP-dependent protease